MHCSDETQDHSQNLVPTPRLEEFEAAEAEAKSRGEFFITDPESGLTQNYCHVPKCTECGAPMKLHCMFFDECYSEHYYRSDSVDSFLQESDCLIVVGTALATGFAQRITAHHLAKELPVIEVNLETSIDRGNNIQVLGKSDVTLPELFNEYYRLMGAGNVVQKSQAKTSSAPANKNQTTNKASKAPAPSAKNPVAKATKGKKTAGPPVSRASARRVSPKPKGAAATKQ